jgi:hypothetical protein
MLTDDPGTPGDGEWEVNFSVTMGHGRSDRSYEAPLLDINYGLGDRIQLKYEIPWLILMLDEHDNAVKTGLGNSEVGIKWRFLDEDRHGVAMSVYPQVAFNNTSSSADRGLVDSGTEFLVPFQVEKNWGKIGVNAELGYSFRKEDRGEWVYGIALGYAFSQRLEVLAELHGTALRDFQEKDLVCNVGARWKLHDWVSVLASAGRSICGPKSKEVRYMGYLGLQFTF